VIHNFRMEVHYVKTHADKVGMMFFFHTADLVDKYFIKIHFQLNSLSLATLSN
jgi:hypothetical protein